MTISLSPDARARLDAHLDAVERALIASGHSRESRHGIVDDLEAQIVEMLSERSPKPAATDVETVLSSLDPPSAYESSSTVPRSPPSRRRPNKAVVSTSKKRRFLVKPIISMTLIVCGTLLIATPAIHHWLVQIQALSLMKARADIHDMHFENLSYDDGWYLHVAGSWAIVAGIAGGVVAFIAEQTRRVVTPAR